MTPVPADALELTLEESLSLLSGADFWSSREVKRGDDVVVRSMSLTDGPHGVRKQPADGDHLGIGDSIPATCFPPAVTLGSTWDTTLAAEFGRALGAEARALDVDVILGPGVNIKRSPLGGRNFEYVSEDPVLAGELAGEIIAGVQSAGVAASLKHFAVNNQETDRMRISADVSERALREIYLEVFRRAVLHGRPWTVMASYNKINGIFAAENEALLRRVLREEWGFTGVIVSDWGGVTDRVASLRAGLDLQMPGPGLPGLSDLRRALETGEIASSLVTESATRIRELADKTASHGTQAAHLDTVAHHDLARRIALSGSVLLVNSSLAGTPALPLDRDAADLVVVGEFARSPRIQGSGSSQVVPARIETPLEALRGLSRGTVAFAPGYTLEGADEELHAEAVAVATASTVVMFLGLPPHAESEGYDRDHLELPAEQIALLRSVHAVAERVIVVLQNGSPVTCSPWADNAHAVLETWLGGQAGGRAVAELLFGIENPSGRLAETIPLALADTPSFTNFPGEGGRVVYGEGIFVGYRHYDYLERPVAFPFGHGLSYTAFEYSDLRVTPGSIPNSFDVRGTVTNVGDRAGAEVVQLYVEPVRGKLQRPVRELKHFARMTLEPGESAEYTFRLASVDFHAWDAATHGWTVESGRARIAIGASSRDIRSTAEVVVTAEDSDETRRLDEWSTLGEALAHSRMAAAIRGGAASGEFFAMSDDLERMAAGMPLRVIADFEGMLFDRDQLATLLRESNLP